MSTAGAFLGPTGAVLGGMRGGAAGFAFVSPCRRYRAEGTVAACPEDVWECIKPVAGGLRTKWDQNVKDFEVVEAVSDVSSLRAVAVGLVSGGFRGIGLCLPKQPTSRAGKKGL